MGDFRGLANSICNPAFRNASSTAKFVALAIIAPISLGMGQPAVAASNEVKNPVADFYAGKIINFYIGYSPGGTYDLYARLLARFMGDHIPGRPRIVPVTMPGGGSRTAAGYVANVAPKDGTVLGTADQALAVEQAMGDKTIQFDASKLNYIGTPIVVNNVTVTWAASGVKTIEDAKKKPITVGATGGSSSSQYPQIMNTLLGTRFKIVLGYPGGPDINLAMERGEVDGRGSNDWVSWKATKPDWIADKKINILDQVGMSKEPDLPDVPLLMDLASNPDDRAVLRLLSSEVGFGRPAFTSPGIPAQRLAALRQAFDETMTDPNFLAEAEKEQLPIKAVSGVDLQKLADDIQSGTPEEVGLRLAALIGEAPR